MKCCLKDKVINASVFDHLRIPVDTDTRVIYFLPKIHKNPQKTRLMMSSSGDHTSRTSGYLDTLLQPHAVSRKSYIKNSSDVIHHLHYLKLPKSSLQVSADIKALYTNISHQVAITSFGKQFSSSHPKFVFLLDLLKFVLRNNAFQLMASIQDKSAE